MAEREEGHSNPAFHTFDTNKEADCFDPSGAAKAMLMEIDQENAPMAAGDNKAQTASESKDAGVGTSCQKTEDITIGTPEKAMLENTDEDDVKICDSDVEKPPHHITGEEQDTANETSHPAKTSSFGAAAHDGTVHLIKKSFGGTRGWPWVGLYKLTPAEKRRRQKATLQRLAHRFLKPKNATMALNETCPHAQRSVELLPDKSAYTAHVSMNGATFTAVAATRSLARAIAAERALQSLVDMQAAPSCETPWPQLASFALHKLLHDWNQQGVVGSPMESPFKQGDMSKKTHYKQKKLPENAALKHPVQLLYEMRPDTQFIYVHEWQEDVPVYKATAIVGELTFDSKGASRKIAKREAAKMALQQICGMEYPDTLSPSDAVLTEVVVK